MTTATALTCKHCGATGGKNGKPFPHKGALNLHESVHCLENPNRGATLLRPGLTKTCCANPSIRLLRVTDQRELWAMHQGMKKVCVNCEECT